MSYTIPRGIWGTDFKLNSSAAAGVDWWDVKTGTEMDGETVILLLSSIYICLWRCERQTDREREREACGHCLWSRVQKSPARILLPRRREWWMSVSVSVWSPQQKYLIYLFIYGKNKGSVRFGSVRFDSSVYWRGSSPIPCMCIVPRHLSIS